MKRPMNLLLLLREPSYIELVSAERADYYSHTAHHDDHDAHANHADPISCPLAHVVKRNMGMLLSSTAAFNADPDSVQDAMMEMLKQAREIQSQTTPNAHTAQTEQAAHTKNDAPQAKAKKSKPAANKATDLQSKIGQTSEIYTKALNKIRVSGHRKPVEEQPAAHTLASGNVTTQSHSQSAAHTGPFSQSA
jgi:hypothetical protein